MFEAAKVSAPDPVLVRPRTPTPLLKTEPLMTKSPVPPRVMLLGVAEVDPISTAPLKTISRSALLLMRERAPLLSVLDVMMLVALVKVSVVDEPLLLVKFMLLPV